MTYKTPQHVPMTTNKDGTKFGFDPSGITGKDAAIHDAQTRFALADPTKILGYILVVCQEVDGADEYETIVDAGGGPTVKTRMLSALNKAVCHEQAARAAEAYGDQK